MAPIRDSKKDRLPDKDGLRAFTYKRLKLRVRPRGRKEALYHTLGIDPALASGVKGGIKSMAGLSPGKNKKAGTV